MRHSRAKAVFVVFLYLFLSMFAIMGSDAGAQFFGRAGGDGLPRDGLVQHVLTKAPEYDSENGAWVSPDRSGEESRQVQPGRCYSNASTSHVEFPSVSEVDQGEPGNFSAFIYINEDGLTASAGQVYFSHYDTLGDKRGWDLGVKETTGNIFFYARLSDDGTFGNRKEYHFLMTPYLAEWHEFGVVFENGELRVYIDGFGVEPDAKQSDSVIEFPYQTDAPLAVGAFYVNGVPGSWAEADFHAARLYNRALSDEEIARAYNEKIIPVQGLVLFAKMEEGYGSISYDSSGNGNHGAIVNATLEDFHSEEIEVPYSWLNEVGYTESAGVYIPRDESNTAKDITGADLQYSGQAKYPAKISGANVLEFDGLGYVKGIANASVIFPDLDNFSIGACFKADTIGPSNYDNRIVTVFRLANSSNFFLALGDSDKLQFAYYDAVTAFVVLDVATIEAGRVYRVVVSMNDNQMKIYLDGSVIHTSTLDLVDILNGPINIGSYNTNDLFDGWISNFTVFNRGLSETEAENLYRRDPIPDGLVLYYPMAEGGSSTLYDVSGNGYNAELFNFILPDSWTSDETGKLFPYNLVYGFTPSSDVKIPALSDGATDALGNPVTNPAGPWHNGAEVVFSQFQAPAIWQADQNCGLGYWFAPDGTPNLKGVDDIVETVDPAASCNQFFANCRNGNGKSDLRIYSREQSGGRLQSINRHYGIK